ncbi:MAG: tRNA glutamyl-Q(34) synthetase GluQRS [Gammaproteobacteria bacterium]|nr:tRNA glutamyl-Q(34) synthetase GluQRS [Gammaproteobacteria bacterium]
MPYTGRFAPTPSGPLHFGSLLTAVASWVDARAGNGRWLLRIDDLDTPRVDPDAESEILATLEAHGLYWDGPVARQSNHVAQYRAALDKLAQRCFACRCTRRQLRGTARYPGTCRNLSLPWEGNAIRIRAEGRVGFPDRVQQAPTSGESGTLDDFVVRRRDGFASYHLAVVVDDHAMGVDHVVRGADLMDDTARQLFLMAALGTAPPSYAHIPVIVEASGVKLSKHNQATAIDSRFARQNVGAALTLLGFEPPDENTPALLDWAIRQWDIARVPAGPVVRGFTALS